MVVPSQTPSATECPNGDGCPIVQSFPSATPQPTARLSFDQASWEILPVIPHLSQNAVAILKEGLALGNNPRAFSKIGDCESRTTWFLGNFDLGEEYYNLGPYHGDLAPVLSYYSGSFNRLSQAAKPGFTAASLLSPLWSDRQVCQKNETPLACEYRLQKPAVAFIMLGTNDAVNPKTFEGHMRKILDFTIAQGVLPILGTKADNIEGNHHINQTIARLAYEYDLPLWNYWLAVQELPGKGLQGDGSHLTYAGPFFDDPKAMRNAWPVRNLNALQILKEIMGETQ
ncbi:MAG: SGNH/GDSL hydrolase family protein [Anaerolineaceae bacterium]|nr:SGNH/GDSL hydrolase family protein [Anaerolineaceae bacterium]